ncbi:hypothetical protein [Actinoplanes italicus]|uniref:hypothetical protein n=1 Tax=Actinoplanes italicus TaxID=113567 RepID=UPI0011B1F51F|nr:hypothetical protein [Actinoplanes italicus]
MATHEITVIAAFDEALRAGDAGDEDRCWTLITHLHLHGGRPALEVAARWATFGLARQSSADSRRLRDALADPRLLPQLVAERDDFLDDPVDEWPGDLRAALARHGERGAIRGPRTREDGGRGAISGPRTDA